MFQLAPMRLRLWILVLGAWCSIFSACGSAVTITATVPQANTMPVVVTYFNQDNAGLTGFSERDGSQVWNSPIGHMDSTPYLVHGVLYGQTNYTQPHSYPATVSLVAVRVSDGHLLWREPLALENENSTIVAISDGVVLTSRESNFAVVARDAATGNVRWSYPADPNPDAEIAVGSGYVYVVTPSKITALHSADGTVAWQTASPGTPFGMAASATALYLNTSYTDLTAFSSTDGHVLWRRSNTGLVLTALSDRALVEIDQIGRTVTFAMLRANDGMDMWSYTEYTYALTQQVIIAQGDVFLPFGSQLIVLRLTDGVPLWRFTGDRNYEVDAPLVTPAAIFIMLENLPASTDGCPPFTDCNDLLYALHPDTGTEYWHREVQDAQLFPVAMSNER